MFDLIQLTFKGPKCHEIAVNTTAKWQCQPPKNPPKINCSCAVFTSQHRHDIITLLSISGQSDTSPLHRQSPQLSPHHHLEVTLGRIPLSTKPTKQHPSHHAIVQPNSTWDRYKRIGERLSRRKKSVCMCVLKWRSVFVWMTSCPGVLGGRVQLFRQLYADKGSRTVGKI